MKTRNITIFAFKNEKVNICLFVSIYDSCLKIDLENKRATILEKLRKISIFADLKLSEIIKSSINLYRFGLAS